MALFERPGSLSGTTYKTKTGLGTLFITINELDNKPVELFARVGKSGHSVNAKTEAIGRLISILMQSDVPVKEIAHQLIGITGDQPLTVGTDLIRSIPDAIGQLLWTLYVKEPRKE